MWQSARLIIFFSLLTPLCVLAKEDAVLQQASELLASNQPGKAVTVLETVMEDRAGNVQYDYLLGKAALQSNQANLAVFALERAVMVAPQESVARYTLAKAYVAVGETEQASQQLSYLIKNSRNDDIRSLSQDYLSRLHNRHQARYQLFLEAGLGKDSNVNSATQKNEFLGIDLSENSQARSSSLSTAKISGQLTYPLLDSISLQAGAELLRYEYPDADFVNTTALLFSSGLVFKTGNTMLQKLQLQFSKTEVDQRDNNQQSIAQFSHQQLFGNAHSLTGSLRYNQVNYAEAFSIKDINGFSSGLQYRYKTRLASKDFFFNALSIIAGSDQPVKSDSPYGRDYFGINSNVLLAHHRGKVNMMASFSYTNSNYATEFFGQSRKENNSNLSLKVNIRLNPRWTLGPSISYVRNHSTVDLYDYRRTQVSVSVRHQVI